jgi:hypothetical protein
MSPAGWLASVLFAVMLGPCCGLLWASGEQFPLIGHDLQVQVDSRWVGCGQGGYCPIRVRVKNTGPTRTLTFRIIKTYQPIPSVRQTVEVPQNATLSVTLAVPMVNESTNAEFRVEEFGRPLENMSHSLSLPEMNSWMRGNPSVLVVASGVVNFEALQDGISTLRHQSGLGGGGHPSYGSHSNTLALEKESLPPSWVDYSGIDFVVIPWTTFGQLPKDTRTALVQWTRCGGTLAITALGSAPTARDELAKSLGGENMPAAAITWSEPKLEDRLTMQIVHEQSGSVSITSPPQNPPGEWPRETSPFQMANLGFGKLIAFRDDPFPGTAQDWFWMLQASGGASVWDWGKRHGLSARQGTEDFLLFLIPGIGGVPVVMFLVLITIFSIVIGPLNYFVLARRKQLHLLLFTIPLIALGTSLLLFGYTIVAHGFSVKARSRSLTYLDQPTQSAVTFQRLSLYAGQAPSSGLRFSRDTAVYPIWPQHEGFESGQLDWTNTQDLTSGWLRSRTRTQFLTVSHRTERGRLEVTASSPEKLTVANGYEWGFEPLVVANDQGRLFVGTSVAAGDSVELQPMTDERLADVARLLQQYPLELPRGMQTTGAASGIFGMHPRYRGSYYYGYGAAASWHWHESMMEQALVRLQTGGVVPRPLVTAGTAATVVPRTFYGVAREAPNVELGVTKATSIHSLHVVMGRW